MKSRPEFDARLNAEIKARLKESRNPKEEALFILDTLCLASYFCAGIIQPGMNGGQTITHIVNRLEYSAQLIHDDKRKRNNDNGDSGTVEGDPIIITP